MTESNIKNDKSQCPLAPATCSAIPASHLDFCREVGRLAKEHRLNRVTITFQPGFRDEWRDQISATWESGRHEEEVGIIHVESTVRVHTSISPNVES
jgi:hypothetical protein